MKRIKILLLFIILIVQLLMGIQLYSDKNMNFYLNTPMAMKNMNITVAKHIDKGMKEKLITTLLQTDNIISMDVKVTGNRTRIYYYSSIKGYDREILQSEKAVNEIKKGNSITRYSGNRFEKQQYDFRYMNEQTDIENIVVYSEDYQVLMQLYEQFHEIKDLNIDLLPEEGFIETVSDYSTEVIKQFAPYFVMVNLVFLIMLMLESTFMERKNSILKLHGFKESDIIFTALRKDLLRYLSIAFLLIIFSLWYLYCEWNIMLYMGWIGIFLFIQICILILDYSILYVVQKHIPVLSGLSNRFKNKGLLWLNFFVKVILAIMASQVLSAVINSMQLLSGEYQVASKLKEETVNMVQLGSLDGTKIEFNEKEMAALFYKTQDVLEKSGSLYIEASRLQYDYKADPNEEVFYDLTATLPNAIRVNDRTLHYFQIKDVEGNLISLKDEDRTQHPFAFIPQSIWNEERISSLKKDPMYADVTFQKIADGQKIFAFDAKVGLSNHGFIENTVFVLDGNTNTEHYLIDVSAHNGNSIRDKFKDWLTENDLPDVYNYTMPQDMINESVATLQMAVLQRSLQVGVLLIGIALLSYQNMYVFLKVNRKKIFVYKIMGGSLWKRYEEFLFSFIGNYALCSLILVLTKHAQSTGVLLIIILIDSLITLYLLQRLEKKSIAIELKGED